MFVGRKLRTDLYALSKDVKAFTLVELAAVIMTVCLTGSIVFPAILHARQKSLQAGCKSNLRQIGLAIQMYADASTGLLPGPLFSEVQTSYDIDSHHELAWFIAKDLGLPAPSTNSALAPTLLCPALRRLARPQDSPSAPTSYLLNDDIDRRKGMRAPPFGDPASSTSPLTLREVYQFGPPPGLFAISDADKGNVNPKASCWQELPYAPVHGKARNQLMFDWHVESKPW